MTNQPHSENTFSSLQAAVVFLQDNVSSGMVALVDAIDPYNIKASVYIHADAAKKFARAPNINRYLAAHEGLSAVCQYIAWERETPTSLNVYVQSGRLSDLVASVLTRLAARGLRLAASSDRCVSLPPITIRE